MIRRTKVPSIPDPTPGGIVEVTKAIKNTLDVREGRAGDKQDRFVTFRDLKDLSVIVDGETDSDDGTKIPGINPNTPGNPTFPGVPPAPTEFTANGGYGVVILSWRPATYGNHSYTEIWRNSIDALSSAAMVGSSSSAVYADPAPDATTYYYWIRFVNTQGVRGPYNSTSGTPATTAINVPRVIEALAGSITESQLYDSLRSRISLIDADATVEGSMAWRVAQQAEEFGTAIRRVTEITNDQGANIARQSQIMTAAFEDSYAAIAEEATTRASQDGVLASQISSVSAAVGAVDARVTTVEQSKIGYATLNATGLVFDNNGVIKDRAGVDAWNAANPGNQATWNVGLPLATAVKQVSVTAANGTTATVQQQFESIYGANGLRAQYSVKIDNNGHVSGFGLSSETVNGTPTSAFIVRADKFAIVGATDTTNPLGTTTPSASTVPFIVVPAGGVTQDGVNYPAGTYIRAAFIADATITAAKIANATITNAQIASGTIVQANIGDAQIGSAKIANTIQSDNFSEAGNTGWQIIARGGTALDGRAIFNNIIARGTVYATNGSFTGTITATSGTIGANIINATGIQSSNYVNGNPGAAGWRIASDGSATFKNLTIYDSNGAVILSSGNKIPWSSLISIPTDIYNVNISIGSNGVLYGAGGGTVTLNGLGAGGLATLDWVGIGSTVRIYNGSSWVTLNTADFVNSLSRINASNIGTFMDAAAIGTAYIGNAAIQNANIGTAAVQTLNISGGSVTAMGYDEQIPQGPYTLSASGTANPVDVTISMAANSTGVVIIGYINMAGVGFGTTISMRILKNGTAIKDIGVSTIGNFFGSFTVTALDEYPVTGNNTYTLQISNPSSGPGGNIDTQYANASIAVTGGKR